MCSETWSGMEEVQGAGLARAIGVSNFNCALLQDLLNSCSSEGCLLHDVTHALTCRVTQACVV